jgi:hypothetical protein
MSDTFPRVLTRDQLRRFLPDHEAVKQFELLMRQTRQSLPADISSALSAAAAAQSTANNALAIAQNHTHTTAQVTDFNQRVMYLLAWGFP